MKIHTIEPKRPSSGKKPFYALQYRVEGKCWICTSHRPAKNGYVKITRHGRLMQLTHYIHEQYKGPVPPGKCVMHTCDVRNCINPDHLVVGTLAENNTDKCVKGRLRNGGRVPLTRECIREIKKRGVYTAAEARRLGISPESLYQIKRGKTFRYYS